MALIMGSQIVICEGILYPFQCPINDWEVGKEKSFRFLDGDLPEKAIFCWQICLAAKGDCVFKDNHDLEAQEDNFAVFC